MPSTLATTQYMLQLSEQHGLDTHLHFIRRLIAASQPRLTSTNPPSSFDQSTPLTFRLLVQETQRLARDPFLADRFREAIDKGEGDIFRHFDLVRFFDRIGLRALEKLILSAAILAVPSRKELQNQALGIVRTEFENACLQLCQISSFDSGDLTQPQLAKLLTTLLCDPSPDSPILEPANRQALISAALAKYGPEVVGPILQQILPTLRLGFLSSSSWAALTRS